MIDLDRHLELSGWIGRIRASQTFGRGSCTSVDEAMTDEELREFLEDFSSFDSAWDFLVGMEETFWDRAGIAWSPSAED